MGRKKAGQGLAEVKAFWEKNPGERTVQAGSQMASISYQSFLNHTKVLVKQGVVAAKKGRPILFRLRTDDEAKKEIEEAKTATPSVLTQQKHAEDFNAEGAIAPTAIAQDSADTDKSETTGSGTV